MDKTKWKSVMLPVEMMDRLEWYARSKIAHEQGYTSKSQIAVAAVREFLEKQYKQHPELEKKPFIFALGEVEEKNGEMFCKNCNSNNCEHIVTSKKEKKTYEIARTLMDVMKKNKKFMWHYGPDYKKPN